MSGKNTLCDGSVTEVQRQPVYWLHAYRYSGDMTLMQALKENLGDPGGINLIEKLPIKEAPVLNRDRVSQRKKGVNKQAIRKSDEAIVVKKSL